MIASLSAKPPSNDNAPAHPSPRPLPTKPDGRTALCFASLASVLCGIASLAFWHAPVGVVLCVTGGSLALALAMGGAR